MSKLSFVLFLLVFLATQVAFSQSPYTWTQKVPGSGHGSSLCVNPLNPNIIYGSPNTNVVWISRDRGNTWVQLGNTGTSGGIAAIAVNPLDTNQIIVAQRGSPNRVMKTTNNGATWTQTWARGSFNSFGVPIEHKSQHPQFVIVMGSNKFFTSNDFGSTWDSVSTASFNAWCDAEISPLDSRIIILGTVASGIWKSTNGGLTWTLKFNNGCSEIPMVAWSPSDPNVVYATRWGGCSSGMAKSTNGGETWTLIQNVPSSMWSLAVSPNNPDYVVSCNYGTSMYVTRNGGQSWTLTNTGLSGSGNGALVVDTFKVFALNGGIFKLNVPENVSSRDVRTVFTVNVNHGVDYHNDMPLTNPTGVWIKGELPILGALQGNWTFGDTVTGTLVPLYDDGSHGDISPGDNIWTRSIIVPTGTLRGEFRYKYGAAYPGIDTVNGGIQYLNNESAVSDFHLATFTDDDSVLILPVDRWKTRGTVAPAAVTFRIDLRGGSDYNSGTAVSSVSSSVWMKGTLPVLGRMGGNWTFGDTVGIMLRLYDDGTNGDAVPGDRVWTRAMTFPENTRVGPFNYKYSAVYPGVEGNGSSTYLDNESAPSHFHTVVLSESTATLDVSDGWLTRMAAAIQVSPASFAVAVTQGDSVTQTLTVTNTAEAGSQSLSYRIEVEDPAFDRTPTFGSYTQTFTGASRDRGNVYSVSRSSLLKEIRSYLGINTPTSMYFFVYEGDTRTGSYSRIFQTSMSTSVGTKWYSSGPIEVELRTGKYYYIGSCWLGSVTYGKAADSTFPGPLPTDFGQLLTGQGMTLAAYPPAASISGGTFSGTSGPYYQSLTVNVTSYVNLSQEEGVLPGEASDAVLITFDAATLPVGEYFPVFTVLSSDPVNPVSTVPGHVVVSPLVAVKGSGTTPTVFALAQNFPNPFNPTTEIRYQLPVAGNVVIKIFSILGQQVAELENSSRQAGYYQTTWDGRNAHGAGVASGLYFYQLTVSDVSGAPLHHERKKMILMK